MSSLWSAGRYESVAERISDIAVQTVEFADRRRPLRDATLVDLACGTGSAALAAARRGARVTAVDLTPELIDQASEKAQAANLDVTWVAADAADTRLPADAFDVVVSNMGIIFVEPVRQVAEIARLIKPAGVLAFSSWVRSEKNPFFDPIVAVLGAPPDTGYSPDQWGNSEVVAQRLAADFQDVEITEGRHGWEFDSLDAALAFVTEESPMHVGTFGRADAGQRDRLREAFREALSEHATADGIRFEAPYVVVTATRRA
jgi:SAM-dependent methyltransferase